MDSKSFTYINKIGFRTLMLKITSIIFRSSLVPPKYDHIAPISHRSKVQRLASEREQLPLAFR